MNLKTIFYKIFSSRHRIMIVAFGIFIGTTSLLFTNRMAQQLKEKEQSEVAMWAYAMSRSAGSFYDDDPLIARIVSQKTNIPFVITDDKLRVIQYHLISDHIANHPDLMRQEIEKMSTINQQLDIHSMDGQTYYLFYGKSGLLKMLVYFPFAQLLVFTMFFGFGYMAVRTSKQDEQNRVWIGLAKETAHQLGTPTSSLLGWIEYLRTQPIDQSAVEDMNKDLTRLLKVVNRFSKIGSETVLSPANVNELVGSSVLYFRTRIPRNVELRYNGLAVAPIKGLVNEPLFEWVIENLIKNSIDALQGKGVIDVKISHDTRWINIDVKDTGKGIAKANIKRIFDPGFTTKTRGWGLGLSLSRRIVEDYHHGRISVLESEVGRGTTIRTSIMLDIIG